MLRRFARQVLSLNHSAASINCQQKRTEVIMRRMYPPRLYKKGETKALKRREFVYIMEDNLDLKPFPEVQVILTMDIEGLGMAGDTITVPSRIARNHLLPGKAAVYASPENTKAYEQKAKENQDVPRQSFFGQKTVRHIAAMTLPIPMNATSRWTLEKKHIRIAFRQVGVEVAESCITLPKEPITSPGEIEFTLTVNNIDKIKVRGVVQHLTEDGEQEYIPVWKSTRRKIEQVIAETVEKNIEKQNTNLS